MTDDWADEKAQEIYERLMSPVMNAGPWSIANVLRDERERCAKIADDFRAGGGFITVADEIAAAIRGRER